MLHFKCPHCHVHLEAHDRKAGNVIACPRCRQNMEVPALTAIPTAAIAESTVPVSCPGCGRAIRLRMSELSAAIECAECGTHFTPLSNPSQPVNPWEQIARAEPPASAGFLNRLSTSARRSIARPTTRGAKVAAWLILACVVSSCVVCGGIIKMKGVDGTETGGKPHQAKVADSDPYSPDCAIVRAWLRQNEGEVEIISWGKRSIFRHATLNDFATLSVTWRRKGSANRKHGLFTIGPGDVVESVSMTD